MTRVPTFFRHEQWPAPDPVRWADRAVQPGFAAEVLPGLRG